MWWTAFSFIIAINFIGQVYVHIQGMSLIFLLLSMPRNEVKNIFFLFSLSMFPESHAVESVLHHRLVSTNWLLPIFHFTLLNILHNFRDAPSQIWQTQSVLVEYCVLLEVLLSAHGLWFRHESQQGDLPWSDDLFQVATKLKWKNLSSKWVLIAF